ncbi:MAG TPA: hypothetical protein VK251_00165 [Steroidobacteraceae bacterium]|nr:hypothetical protein [Steroidobacteraceae bacterium]
MLPDLPFATAIGPHLASLAREALCREALRAHLERRLVAYKRPRSFEFVNEPLRADDGKVRRSALRSARLGKFGR